MPMRLSGLMSGMDTESIIQDLVAARRVKVDNAKKAQTKLSWKQEAWKDLNTKLKNLQSKYLNNMRFVSSYSKRTTRVSNSNAVSVLTGSNAVNGVQSLKIEHLAKTGYLTGGMISKDGKEFNALSKLSDLGITEEGTFNIKAGSKSVDITVNGDTTISDVLTNLKEAGVNANFDAKQQRFFVSAKESGLANDFSITAADANGDAALAALGLKTNVSDDKAAMAAYKEYADFYVAGDETETLKNINADGRITKDIDSRVNNYLKQYKSLVDSKETAQKKIDEIHEKYKDESLKSAEEYQTELDAKNAEMKSLEDMMKAEDSPLTADEMREAEEKLMKLKKEALDITTKKTDAETLAKQNELIADYDTKLADVESYVDITATTDVDGNVTYSAAATSKLNDEVNNRYINKASYANDVINNGGGATIANGATKINAQDAVIYLNGAKFTNTDNVFEINGLTITALNETKPDEEITITTQDDVDGIYDMVKDFLKEYNSVINEIDKLYNADATKGYEPLTDEEKESMSEKDIEKYEEKIKDALLRRDSNLSSVGAALKEVMSSGISVNGKNMYLSHFGINTMGYFEAPDNEKNAYHIDGDADDEKTSGNADVLKGMISNDPNTVISFFSQLSKNLYAKMDSMSKSVDGYRTYGSFYDDKKMKEEYGDYTSKIKELEAKLNDYEDRWYAKFAKMETAMAKLQKNTSAITSLLGGGF